MDVSRLLNDLNPAQRDVVGAPEGPLLILANHPGAFDSIFVSAMLRRDDLQILAWGWPLLRRLPATSRP